MRQQQSQNICIRQEQPQDYRAVEKLIREAFYNLYVPGCSEHYLAHVMRPHKDFLPPLDLVLELDGRVIGSVMYTKARLVDPAGNEKQILTFGPVCISPAHQRRGYGKMLLDHSFEKAVALGYQAIVIFGSPGNYVGCGFKSCMRYSISLEGGVYPAAMLVKELVPGSLAGKSWLYYDSPVMQIDQQAAQQFDESFPPKEKKHQPSQEEFYIHSHAILSEASTVE